MAIADNNRAGWGVVDTGNTQSIRKIMRIAQKRRVRGKVYPKGRGNGGFKRRRYSQGGRSSEMAPLTNDKDVRQTYKRKPMAKGKKKRYVSSLKKFRALQLRNEPSRISLFVHTLGYSAAADTCKYFGSFMGLLANTFYDNSLGDMFNQMTVAGNTAAAKARQSFLRVDHQSLSVAIRNTTSAVANGSGVIDMDVYKVVVVRDIPLDRWATGISFESMAAALKSDLRQHQGMDIEVGDNVLGIPVVQENAGTSDADQAVGDTLFNNPPLCRYFRIVKMWKIQVAPQQVVHFNMRDSKNYVVHRDMCIASEAAALAAKRYVTKGYVFNINGRALSIAPYSFEPVTAVVETYVRYNAKPIVSHSDTLVYDGRL